MLKEIIETGKTVDAAIDSACEKLGCERDECQFEILDLPKKGFLGLKNIPAKVRVSIESPEPKEEPKSAPRPAQRPAPQARKDAPKVRPAQERPAGEQKPARPSRPPQETAPAAPAQQKPAQAREEEPEAEKILITEGFTEKETTAMAYIQGILRQFELAAQLNLYREGPAICIDITGDGLGAIIGRRGETLDAIQYLTGLVANRLEGEYLRITVDCGDYRGKRKETLEALAKKLAAQVLKTNTSKTLEPMNPFERRVIHATISKIEGVSSSSIGEEPNRRVIITTPTARRPSGRGGRGRYDSRDRNDRGGRPPRGDRNDRSGGDRGDRYSRGDRRPPRSGGSSRPPQPKPQEGPPKQTPETEIMGDAPIGKLDLE